MTEPRRPRRKVLTDYPADLRAAVADGWEVGTSTRAIALAAGVGESTVRRILALLADAGALPERSAGVAAARARALEKRAAASEARAEQMAEARTDLADLLLRQLGRLAAAALVVRLEEQAGAAERVALAEQALDDAVVGLEALAAPDDAGDPATPEEKATKAELRKAARERVSDARLVLAAYREGRIPVPALVGVLTRAVGDHLALEGKASALPGAGAIVVEFGAPLPDATPPRIWTQAELAAGAGATP